MLKGGVLQNAPILFSVGVYSLYYGASTYQLFLLRCHAADNQRKRL